MIYNKSIYQENVCDAKRFSSSFIVLEPVKATFLEWHGTKKCSYK